MMRKLIALFSVITLLFVMCAACASETPQEVTPPVDVLAPPPPEPTPAPTPRPIADDTAYFVDWSNGNTEFLRLNPNARRVDPAGGFEIVNLDGENALKLTAPGGGAVHVGVSVESLLGSRAADVKHVVFEVYVETPDGQFFTNAGRVNAINEALEIRMEDFLEKHTDEIRTRRILYLPDEKKRIAKTSKRKRVFA